MTPKTNKNTASLLKDSVQIAGIKDIQEANLLIKYGVKYIGIPLYLDIHEEDISSEVAKDIIRTFPDDVEAVVITYLADGKKIASLCKELGARIVQLHGPIDVEELKLIKRIIKGIIIIKSLIVNGDNFYKLQKEIQLYTPYVDAFITDTFDPDTGASGATGKTHDWQISRKIVESSCLPIIIAGGLTPNNVRDAILEIKPSGVDSHTGVESGDGRKDGLLVSRFVEEAITGFNTINKI